MRRWLAALELTSGIGADPFNTFPKTLDDLAERYERRPCPAVGPREPDLPGLGGALQPLQPVGARPGASARRSRRPAHAQPSRIRRHLVRALPGRLRGGADQHQSDRAGACPLRVDRGGRNT